MAEAIVLVVYQASSQEEGRGKTDDCVVSCTVVKRALRRDGDASAGDLGQIRFRGSQTQSGYHRLSGRRTQISRSKVAQRWPQVGRHAATTESKSSKTRRQRGTGS